MDERNMCPIFSLIGAILKEQEIGECLELNCAMYNKECKCCGLISQRSEED